MPIMDGLQATRLVRSFEETRNWDAARKAGIEQSLPASDLPKNECSLPSTKQMPIIAVSNYSYHSIISHSMQYLKGYESGPLICGKISGRVEISIENINLTNVFTQ